MPHAPIRTKPIRDGGVSVLSGKDEIRGLSRSPTTRPSPTEPKSCKSVLEGPECIQGAAGQGLSGKRSRRSAS
jgi:hypothetical protein